jgi:all-trans-retinol 13,14-reductase
MAKPPASDEFDVIVIGSGMGGMTTAAALSRFDHKVLLLEQAQTIGGLTHSFTRNGFSWDVGLHYCGDFGSGQFAGRMLDWLSGGTIEFRSVGTVYDTLHFPDDVDISVGRPAEAYKRELKDRYPDNAAEIDAYFEAVLAAEEAGQMVGAERAMPDIFRSAYHWWNRRKIERWCGRTTSEVIEDLITEPQLAAILSAQWGTYGGKPSEASFAVHAVVMGHYLEGAAYPVGGAAAIAKGLVPAIEASGGVAMAGTAVSELVIDDGKAVGVRTSTGQEFRSEKIVSAIGAGETVKHLLPDDLQQEDWAKDISTFKPSVCHFEVYIGFEGDITKYGATRANQWFFESWDTNDRIWSGAADDPIQMMFVSFPSLKDPEHDPGPAKRHTGDMMVLADWSSVAEFADGGAAERPSEWAALKERVEAQMLDFFARKFPALAPLITYQELGTPLATAAFTGHNEGGFYGIETTPRRMLSEVFNARTPIPGLFLSGQDVMSPGIAGALAGGLFGAAAVDPRVFQKLR